MSEFISFFQFFYKLRGMTLFYLMLIMLVAGLAEVISLSMFLPLLEGGNLDGSAVQTFVTVFDFFGVEYSFGKVLGLMVFFFFLSGACLIIKESYIGKINAGLLVDLRREIVHQLFEVDYRYFLKKDTGYINNAVTVEFQNLTFAFKMYANVLLALIFGGIYFVVPLTLNPWVAGSVLVVGIPAFFVIKKINQLTKVYSVQNSEQSGQLQAFLIQTLHNFKYLKATHSQRNILDKVDRASQKLGTLLFRQTLLNGLTTYGFTPFVILIVAVLLFYEVEMAGRETAEVVFILYLLKRAIDKALSTQISYRKFLMSVGSINVYRQFKRELQTHNEELHRAGLVPDFDQPIQFKQVSFRYDQDEHVLKNINLVIPPRTTVAFVGASGSGKSTLVTLLTGLLQPSEGEILLGKESYAALDHALLRSGIGYVTQESVIFNGTIRDNITLWDKNASAEQVKSATTKAHIQEFIEDLPQGYEALLGDNGLNISGGQRQRISIARELFKDINLLIFDEATSALDSHSEKEIQKNIDEFRGEKTIVLVAHRLSTVQNSDLIFVMEKGRIVEKGTYEQLYRLNGLFREMINLQTTTVHEPNGQRMEVAR